MNLWIKAGLVGMAATVFLCLVTAGLLYQIIVWPIVIGLLMLLGCAGAIGFMYALTRREPE